MKRQLFYCSEGVFHHPSTGQIKLFRISINMEKFLKNYSYLYSSLGYHRHNLSCPSYAFNGWTAKYNQFILQVRLTISPIFKLKLPRSMNYYDSTIQNFADARTRRFIDLIDIKVQHKGSGGLCNLSPGTRCTCCYGYPSWSRAVMVYTINFWSKIWCS